LDVLGIDEDYAAAIGLTVYKVGMTWPLEREGVRQFAEGLEEILVVEEKRALIENQLKEQLYNWKESVRPKVIGKFDEDREWILPSADELTPARIARVIAKRIARFHTSETIDRRLAFLTQKEQALTGHKPPIQRIPYFCSGCPHNRSTVVPQGSVAAAGIGCHGMAMGMDRGIIGVTHMGAEGAQWVGIAPFTETPHLFQNIGDGTFFHSGGLALNYAVASGVNITYKLLYNGAVAMTGGQAAAGALPIPALSRRLEAEGVKRIIITSDDPAQYSGVSIAGNAEVWHRDRLLEAQSMLAGIGGVTVLIHDQHCAAEKRRLRKRGKMIDPQTRVFINERVCEGCGDCGKKSNCLSVQPIDTEFGRKTVIHQSSCNKDYSCLLGDCPSFLTVEAVGPAPKRERRLT
ncbi:MAG: thiamine pyrophosphate-dependent enzyme, partial [Candidatus Rokuibacteriota bacterium]